VFLQKTGGFAKSTAQLRANLPKDARTSTFGATPCVPKIHLSAEGLWRTPGA
jgi:hypothetical protein